MQTPQSLGITSFYVGANVEVGADVVVAAGAVLEAAPGAQLIIESGVCIGAGVVIQAYGGELRLGTGANVGQAVLLLGVGQIGAHACIGAESTLINPNVAANGVISARSLLGDRSAGQPASSAKTNGHSPPAASQNGSRSTPVAEPAPTTENHDQVAHNGNDITAYDPVYGREQVMQLMKTLFPHRDALNVEDNAS